MRVAYLTIAITKDEGSDKFIMIRFNNYRVQNNNSLNINNITANYSTINIY